MLRSQKKKIAWAKLDADEYVARAHASKVVM